LLLTWRAVELADFQYREGEVDYTRVLDTQQFLVVEQDCLVITKGLVALNLITLYKTLGGGCYDKEKILSLDSRSVDA
jgi:outer membrane protein TolC